MRVYMNNRRRSMGYDYPLAVGSDETVHKDKYDALRLKRTDLAHPVTTDAEKIAKYLRRRKGGQMVFATYQSIDKVAAACRKTGIRFDLMVADEAHHCATQNGTSNFATVLDPKRRSSGIHSSRWARGAACITATTARGGTCAI
jgi:predicted helicase